jgi:hypothetical protein
LRQVASLPSALEEIFMRKAEIETTISIKINTSNFEVLDVIKTIKTEVEFERIEDLRTKSAALDKLTIDLAKAEAEAALSETGRSRYAKSGNSEGKIDTWCDAKSPTASTLKA